MILTEQCIIKFNKPNKNGRIYSSECFNLDDPVIKEKLNDRIFFGEFGFPEDSREEIDMSKVSHAIKKLYKTEDGLYADIEILETPKGKLLEDIINKGNQVSFRPRGSGDLIHKEDGSLEVTNYTLYSIDYTSNPA